MRRANRFLANLIAFPALLGIAAAGEYQAQVVRVIDGDTIVADIRLGFGVELVLQPIRLSNANAPEKDTEAGVIAKGWLATQLEGKTVTLITTKTERDKYGRVLARVLLDGKDIGEQAKAEHFAHGGPGRKDGPQVITK